MDPYIDHYRVVIHLIRRIRGKKGGSELATQLCITFSAFRFLFTTGDLRMRLFIGGTLAAGLAVMMLTLYALFVGVC